MGAPQIKSVYSVEDFDVLGFHDCCVHGIRWDSASYALIIDLDYIVQWIENNGSYEFWVAPAELYFAYSSEVKISLDWTRMTMECPIQDVHKHECRMTPNESEEYHWEIEFANPYGAIELWSGDFELRIQAEPVLSKTQRLRGSGLT